MDQYMDRIYELPESCVEELKYVHSNTEGFLSINEALLLYCLAKDAESGCIVEIGSYRGKSSVFLGKGSLAGYRLPVHAVEPHKTFTVEGGGKYGARDRTVFYETMLKHQCSEIVSLINLSSEQFTSNWTDKISLLWIDGDHSYNGVKRDFTCWEPHLDPEAVVAFHDSIDPQLGPRLIINELLRSGTWEQVSMIDSITVIRRRERKPIHKRLLRFFRTSK